MPRKTAITRSSAASLRSGSYGDIRAQKGVVPSRSSRTAKAISYHGFRHSFAIHLLECDQDIRMIQELLGYSDGRVTMIHDNVLN